MFARIVLMLAAIAWMVGVIVLIMSKSVMHEILAALLLSFGIIFGALENLWARIGGTKSRRLALYRRLDRECFGTG